METINLKVSKKIYAKVLMLLNQFKPEDLQIISNDDANIKAYLQEQIKEMDSENAEFLSIEDLNDLLEKTIVAYES
uniref:hypothetical protein n=1 Tax=Gelidibacter sp. TaxID=2018083 RepID=UPI00404A5D06